jgi:hypothetical protein
MATMQMANFVDFPAMTAQTKSAATLTRTYMTLHAAMALHGLDPNTAYSVWWAVYNSPENCTDGAGHCGMPDMANPSAELGIFYATGFVTGSEGNANLTADLKHGDLPLGYEMLAPGSLHKRNGKKAEVQLVIRTHGEVIPGRVAEQIGTYNGACEVNTCAEQYIVSFPAVD